MLAEAGYQQPKRLFKELWIAENSAMISPSPQLRSVHPF
jgi:hypothetical protein